MHPREAPSLAGPGHSSNLVSLSSSIVLISLSSIQNQGCSLGHLHDGDESICLPGLAWCWPGNRSPASREPSELWKSRKDSCCIFLRNSKRALARGLDARRFRAEASALLTWVLELGKSAAPSSPHPPGQPNREGGGLLSSNL